MRPQTFSTNFLLWTGASILGLAALVGVFGPLIMVAGPWEIRDAPFIPPFSNMEYLLGTDALGRDVLTGIVYGARVSLGVGIATAVIVLAVGGITGAFAGYFGGTVDVLLSSIVGFFQTIPTFIFALVVVAIFKPSIGTTIAAISLVSWPGVARIVRAEMRSLREREFVNAALLAGRTSVQIVFFELLPNVYSRLAALGALTVANAILMESAISFIGLGDANVMTWGYMVGAARSMLAQAWWLSIVPSLAIMGTVLGVYLLAEGLRVKAA